MQADGHHRVQRRLGQGLDQLPGLVRRSAVDRGIDQHDLILAEVAGPADERPVERGEQGGGVALGADVHSGEGAAAGEEQSADCRMQNAEWKSAGCAAPGQTDAPVLILHSAF